MESCQGHTGVIVSFRQGYLTSIRLLKFFEAIFNKDHAYTTPGATYHFLRTGLSSCMGLEVTMNISGDRNCSTSDRFSLSDLFCMFNNYSTRACWIGDDR